MYVVLYANLFDDDCIGTSIVGTFFTKEEALDRMKQCSLLSLKEYRESDELEHLSEKRKIKWIHEIDGVINNLSEEKSFLIEDKYLGDFTFSYVPSSDSVHFCTSGYHFNNNEVWTIQHIGPLRAI